MFFFLIYILIYHSGGKEIPCNHASEARSSRLRLLVRWPDF